MLRFGGPSPWLPAVAWVGAAVVATGVGRGGPADPGRGLPSRPSLPGKSSAAAEKEAEAFLATVTGLLGPVAMSANLADWAAATDVTPEHTGQRTGADKTLAALAGSKLIIEKTKALLKNESSSTR